MTEQKVHRTLVVEEALWKAWHIACIAHRVTMSEAMRQLIMEQLARWQAEAGATARGEDGQAAADVGGGGDRI